MCNAVGRAQPPSPINDTDDGAAGLGLEYEETKPHYAGSMVPAYVDVDWDTNVEIPWNYSNGIPGEYARRGKRAAEGIATHNYSDDPCRPSWFDQPTPLALLQGEEPIRLTDLERSILKLRLAGTRQRVIATQLGCSVGLVKKVTARWRDELHALVGETGDGRLPVYRLWWQSTPEGYDDPKSLFHPQPPGPFRRLTAAGVVEVNRRHRAREPLRADGLEWDEREPQLPRKWKAFDDANADRLELIGRARLLRRGGRAVVAPGTSRGLVTDPIELNTRAMVLAAREYATPSDPETTQVDVDTATPALVEARNQWTNF